MKLDLLNNETHAARPSGHKPLAPPILTTPILTTPIQEVPQSRSAAQNALSSNHHYWVIEPSTTVLKQLEILLPHIDPTTWQDRMDYGGLYLNGRPVHSDQTISIKSWMEYYEPKYAIHSANTFFPEFRSDFVLYNDDLLAIVFKPAGLPTSPSREQSHYSLKRALEKELGRTVHLPSRLDTSTQGVVVASLHRDIHPHLHHLYQFRKMEKSYRFTVPHSPTWSTARIEAKIARSEIHPVLRTVHSDKGDDAVTDFEVLRASADSCLLFAFPRTGRTHQIRVHAAAFLGPIDGDRFYQGRATADGLHLVSSRIRFPHPKYTQMV
ncbi:MAG: hypothetical protein KDD60_04505, partial [Bdellovibrionales bacterium]|nr:hypothetical protein [Bdellovibrionales bacterium]